MRSAKSTSAQERDRDEVNKVDLERAKMRTCAASEEQNLTTESEIICCTGLLAVLLFALMVIL